MLKILYAADNRWSSYFNLQRFLKFSKKDHIIKIAAHSFMRSDWNLDSLLNIGSEIINFNGNYKKYLNWIKDFSPNLIISDLEVFTGYAGIELNIPTWVVSPALIYYAIQKRDKDKLEIFKLYSYYFTKTPSKQKYIKFIIKNCDRRLVLSHFCDTNSFPALDKDFEWVRPEFELADVIDEKDCNCGIIIDNPKEIINYCKGKDSYLFSNIGYEHKKNIEFKLLNDPEYTNILSKSNSYLSQADEFSLSDAFYNSKEVVLFPRKDDIECIINSALYQKFGLGRMYYSDENIRPPEIAINDSVKFLKELL